MSNPIETDSAIAAQAEIQSLTSDWLKTMIVNDTEKAKEIFSQIFARKASLAVVGIEQPTRTTE